MLSFPMLSQRSVAAGEVIAFAAPPADATPKPTPLAPSTSLPSSFSFGRVVAVSDVSGVMSARLLQAVPAFAVNTTGPVSASDEGALQLYAPVPSADGLITVHPSTVLGYLGMRVAGEGGDDVVAVAFVSSAELRVLGYATMTGTLRSTLPTLAAAPLGMRLSEAAVLEASRMWLRARDVSAGMLRQGEASALYTTIGSAAHSSSQMSDAPAKPNRLLPLLRRNWSLREIFVFLLEVVLIVFAVALSFSSNAEFTFGAASRPSPSSLRDCGVALGSGSAARQLAQQNAYIKQCTPNATGAALFYTIPTAADAVALSFRDAASAPWSAPQVLLGFVTNGPSFTVGVNTFAFTGAVGLIVFTPMTFMFWLGIIGLMATMAPVAERKSGVRERLRLAGVNDLLYTASTVLYCVLRSLPASLLMFGVVFKVLGQSPAIGLLLLTQLALVTTSSQALFVAAFTADESNSGAFVAATMWFFVPIITPLAPVGMDVLMLVLCPGTAFWHAIAWVIAPDNFNLAVSLGGYVGILVAQAVVFAFLGLWIGRMRPARFARALGPVDAIRAIFRIEGAAPNTPSDHACSPAIDLVAVQKTFKKRTVLDATLRIRRGACVALLGSNGAGKSTLLSILCGQLQPDACTRAQVLGFDVEGHIRAIRDKLGYCPQEDGFVEHLSVRAHINLFASLRGAADGEVDSLLSTLELDGDAKPDKLSGGQKRCVSVACAVVGTPALVLLDEPTTGVDDRIRAKVWELLAAKRAQGATVVIATHLMEEAEAACDEVVVMSYGSIVAQGTAPELKLQHGAGHTLLLHHAIAEAANAAVSSPRDGEDQSETTAHSRFDAARADAIVTGAYPSAVLRAVVPNTRHEYFLPTKFDHGFDFGALLQAVEREAASIGVAAVELRQSTLDDAVVNILSATDHDALETLARLETTLPEMNSDAIQDAFDRSTRIESRFAQLRGVFSLMLQLRWEDFARHIANDLLSLIVVPLVEVIMFVMMFVAINNRQSQNSSGIYFQADPATDSVQVPILLTKGTNAAAARFATDYLQPAVTQALRQEFELSSRNVHVVVVDPDGLASLKFLAARRIELLLPYSEILSVVQVTSDVSNIVIATPQYATGTQSGVPLSRYTVAIARGVYAAERAFTAPSQQLLPLPAMSVSSSSTNPPAPTSKEAASSSVSTRSFILFYSAFCWLLVCFQVFGYAGTVRDRFERDDAQLVKHGLSGFNLLVPNVLVDFLVTSAVAATFITVAACIIGAAPDASTERFYGLLFISTVAENFAAVVGLQCVGKNVSRWLSACVVFLWLAPAVPAIVFAVLETELPFPPQLIEALSPLVAWISIYVRGSDPTSVGGTLLPVVSLFCFHPPLHMALLYAIGRSMSARDHCNRYKEKEPRGNGATAVGVVVDPSLQIMANADVAAEAGRLKRAALELGRPEDAAALLDVEFEFSDKQGGPKPFCFPLPLTFGAPAGQVVGLIGPNGAGKSTLLSLLVKDAAPKKGAVTYGSLDADYDGSDVLTRIRLGYCPQEDALNVEGFTAMDYMRLYLGMRLGREAFGPSLDADSLEASQWRYYARTALGLLGVPLHECVATMNGGAKRKLTVALALFCGSQLIVLDEPTNGVDPVARLAVWRVIRWWAKARRRTVVVTTHSMDEAEALCDRIHVMTGGAMRRIGTPLALRAASGLGYVAEVTVGPHTNVAALDDAMVLRFGTGAKEVAVTHGGCVRSYPIGELRRLAEAYRELVAVMRDCRAEHVSIGRASLRHAYMAILSSLDSWRWPDYSRYYNSGAAVAVEPTAAGHGSQ